MQKFLCTIMRERIFVVVVSSRFKGKVDYNRFVILNCETFISTGTKGRFGTIQQFIVPNTSQYSIVAYGAKGGTHTYNYGYRPGTYFGGKGAKMQGLFNLTKGTVLKLIVGQKGGNSVEIKGGAMTTNTAAELGISVEDNAGTGGGGGSFVYTSDNNLLIAAWGGGGASGGYHGRNGEAGTAGTSSRGYYLSRTRNGGTGGQPGECNNKGSWHGGLRAGWLGQGCSRQGTSHGQAGGSRAQGWLGGLAGRMNGGRSISNSVTTGRPLDRSVCNWKG